jgi:hypothetical protein
LGEELVSAVLRALAGLVEPACGRLELLRLLVEAVGLDFDEVVEIGVGGFEHRGRCQEFLPGEPPGAPAAVFHGALQLANTLPGDEDLAAGGVDGVLR